MEFDFIGWVAGLGIGDVSTFPSLMEISIHWSINANQTVYTLAIITNNKRNICSLKGSDTANRMCEKTGV